MESFANALNQGDESQSRSVTELAEQVYRATRIQDVIELGDQLNLLGQ